VENPQDCGRGKARLPIERKSKGRSHKRKRRGPEIHLGGRRNRARGKGAAPLSGKKRPIREGGVFIHGSPTTLELYFHLTLLEKKRIKGRLGGGGPLRQSRERKKNEWKH